MTEISVQCILEGFGRVAIASQGKNPFAQCIGKDRSAHLDILLVHLLGRDTSRNTGGDDRTGRSSHGEAKNIMHWLSQASFQNSQCLGDDDTLYPAPIDRNGNVFSKWFHDSLLLLANGLLHLLRLQERSQE